MKSSAFNNENINRSLQSVVPQQLAGSWASHGRIIGARQQLPWSHSDLKQKRAIALGVLPECGTKDCN